MAHILGPVGVSCPARLVQGVFPTSCLRMTFFSLLTKLWVLIEMTSCTGRPAVAPGTRKQPWFLGSYTHTHTHILEVLFRKGKVFMFLHRLGTENRQKFQQFTEWGEGRCREHNGKPENTTSVMSTGPAASVSDHTMQMWVLRQSQGQRTWVCVFPHGCTQA